MSKVLSKVDQSFHWWVNHTQVDSGQSSKMWSIIPKMDLPFSHTEISQKWISHVESESVILKVGQSSQKWVSHLQNGYVGQSCQIIFTLASLINSRHTCILEHITFATLGSFLKLTRMTYCAIGTLVCYSIKYIIFYFDG